MNFLRKTAAIFICITVFLCSAQVCFARSVPADVGNFNDYGGGNDYGGNDYNYDYGGGYGGTYGGASGSSGIDATTIIIFVVVMGLIVVFSLVKKKHGKSYTVPKNFNSAAGVVVTNHDERITVAIQEEDKNFSRERFLAWASQVFMSLQEAWTERDWSKIRPFEKEELFRQHESQINHYISMGQINVLDRVCVEHSYLNHYKRDKEYEYLTVLVAARMGDYIIDEKSRSVIKGDPSAEYHLKYLLTFMRKRGVKTDTKLSNLSTVSCPNCGAPLKMTAAGKCEYCESIITTGDHDWVMLGYTGVKPGTPVDNSGVEIIE